MSFDIIDSVSRIEGIIYFYYILNNTTDLQHMMPIDKLTQEYHNPQ